MARTTHIMITALLVLCFAMDAVLCQDDNSTTTESMMEDTSMNATMAADGSNNATDAPSNSNNNAGGGSDNTTSSGMDAATDASMDNSTATAAPDSDDTANATSTAAMADDSTDAATASPQDTGDGVTVKPDASGTAEPEAGTATPEPAGNGTDSNNTKAITCYECSGEDCAKDQKDSTMMCTSATGVCYMLYDLKNMNNTARGCDSSVNNMTACTDVYPGGNHANDKCGYCCTKDKCNNNALTATECTKLAMGSSPRIHATGYVISGALLLVTLIVQWQSKD